MKVNIEDVLFWMDAIRNSDDRYRTLESFWKGQVHSKIWLIENLKRFAKDKPNRIVIHGGWNGVLAALLFNSDIPIEKIISVDIDPKCEQTAFTVNKRYEMQGRFISVTDDMAKYEYSEKPDIVINTSTEHVYDSAIDQWLDNIPQSTLVVAQNNDFFEIKEHINCVKSVTQLKNKVGIHCCFEGDLAGEKYSRFMIIGKKIDKVI
jgi:hypothetical protein